MTVDAIIDPAAVDLLASRLRTPLQIEQHLTLALETGYQASEKPVSEAIVEFRPVQADRRPGADADAARLHAEDPGRNAGRRKPGEIKALFSQTLEADRARELKEQMLAAGLPV